MIGRIGEMKRPLLIGLLLQSMCFAGAAFVLVLESVRGAISLNQLRIGIAILVGCLVLSTVCLRYFYNSRMNRGPANWSHSNAAVRKLKVAVVAFPVLLIVGLLLTRGAPLAPRLVGVAVNLFFTFCFVSIIRRAKIKR